MWQLKVRALETAKESSDDRVNEERKHSIVDLLGQINAQARAADRGIDRSAEGFSVQSR
jgi:hypothetical protein